MLSYFSSTILKSITPEEDKTVAKLLSQEFAYLMPTDWINNGFEVLEDGSGIGASGVGGMGYNISYDTNSFLDRMVLQVDFVVGDLNSSFAIAKNLAFRGNVVKADFSTNTLYLGILTSQGVEPVYEFSTQFSNVTKILGNTYSLRLVKDRQIISCRIFNKDTPYLFDEIVRDYDVDDTFVGSCWGNPSAIFFNGDIVINKFIYESLDFSTPKVAMYGDSITEGYTLIDQVGNLKSRWSDKVWVANTNNAYISARGGHDTSDTLTYIDFELAHFTPYYIIIFLGANDSNFNIWKVNMDALISKIIAKGSVPILATILPRSDRQSFINQANNQIINIYGYNYIDFAAAVTTNRDRLNWVSSHLLPDNVHPTVEGHQAMYNEIVNNNSYLIS